MENTEKKSDLRVINIGVQFFYDALLDQGIKATQLEWRPPVKQPEEINQMLDMFL